MSPVPNDTDDDSGAGLEPRGELSHDGDELDESFGGVHADLHLVDETYEPSWTPDSVSIWDGDQGTLSARQRDALVTLLKKEFISSDDTREWRTLVSDPGPIEANLNNLYFTLVVDRDREVAFKKPVRSDDLQVKTLVRDNPNNREETLILIGLRERFRAGTSGGEHHVFVEEDTIKEYVERFRPAWANDHLADGSKVLGAIKTLTSAGILVKTPEVGRYRIHRAIEALLPLSRLKELLDGFHALSHGTPADPEVGDPDRDTEGDTDDTQPGDRDQALAGEEEDDQ